MAYTIVTFPTEPQKVILPLTVENWLSNKVRYFQPLLVFLFQNMRKFQVSKL